LHLVEDLALTTEHGFRFYLGFARAFRGRSLIALGQAQEGLAQVTQGLAEVNATGGVVSTPMLFTWLAQAHVMLGQPAEALDCLGEAARIVETTAERVSEAELLYRVPGDLLNATGDRSGAEQHYRQGHRRCRAAERKALPVADIDQPRPLLSRPRQARGSACDLLGPIYNWFTEGFDAPDLKDAKALLDELA
jgi:predicted ATPase